MKAKELMIGDWVQDLSPVIIDAISNEDICTYQCKDGYITVNPSNLKPLPLTAEILEKNGWKTTDRYRYNCADVWFDIIERDRGDFDIEVSAYDGGFAYVATIYYVHEFQHALRFCGIEKEIEL